MASRSGLEDLELTGDEVERLTKAFQDEGFRTLFAQYAAELADPEQRATYEAEVAALERQRGVEARFVHPAPGWVLRTSQAGTRRCYLNVCSNPLVGRPEARPEPGGSCWSLPHCLAPGREELSCRRRPLGPPRRPRLVYDVVFHPDTLRLAARSARFRRLVDDTALEAVEKHYAPGLDRANAVPLRGTKYKGVPQATLLRTPLPGGAPPPEAAGGGEGGGPPPPLPPFPSPYAYPPAEPEREAQPPRPPPPAPAATTPRWTLRHRSYVDLQDYRNCRDSAPSPVPRELVVTIELPLLSSAAQAQLEIRGRELQLDSRRPAAYHLRLPLPYAVDEGGGRATFNKAKKQLVVTLPVLAKPGSGAVISHGQASQGQSEEARAEEEEDGEEEPSEPPRGGSGPVSPRERQEEEDAAAATPADGSAALRPKPGRAREQAPPVPHEDAGSASPPACAVERPPAAGSTCSAAPLCSEAAPLEAHVPTSCSSSELPACAGDTAPTGAAGFSLLLPVCNGNISPEVPTCSSGVGLCVSRDDTGSVSTAELPVHPSSTSGPVPPVSPVALCTCMDLNPCPGITDVMSSSCPSEDGLSRSVTTLSGHDCSKVDQRPAWSTSTDLPVPTSHVDLPVPALSPGNRKSVSPLVSTTGPSTYTDTPINSTSCRDSSVPSASSTPLPCPHFHCTQDEKALTLLLEVPGIVPQSLKGEVGANHYRISFSNKASAAYSYFFQFLPENKLAAPEIRISVSPNNAVITLAKSPETTGVWTKLYFGPNVDALQERWFVTENNVDAFLSSLLRTSHSSQSKIEHQPLLEVLDVSEGKSQIRIKAQEQNSCELGKTEERVNPRRGYGGQEGGEELSTGAENCPVQIERVSGSLTATETMGRVGKGSGHCVLLDPSVPGLAVPEKLQISEVHESELAFTTGKRATSTLQAQLSLEKPAQTGEKEDAHSQSAQDKKELGSSPAPTVLKETMRDGSVQYSTYHTTHCAVTFQNALLYELD